MKFLHISDTHLGYKQYGLEDRERDFFDVFEEAIDIAIQQNVDFIIHTGDFFHTSKPSNSCILDAINLLNKLKSSNIPIFAISGNHDRGGKVRDVSPLEILKNFGLTVVDNSFIEYNGVNIAGVKYISKLGLKEVPLKEIIEYLQNQMQNSSNFNILMLHQEFNPYFPGSNLYLQVDIPEGFDYIGIGHLHIPQEPLNINGATVVYAGSTEFTAYNKEEEKYPKKVHLVEFSSEGINYKGIPLKNRRQFITVNFEKDNLDKLIQDIKLKLEEEFEKKPVLILQGELYDVSIRDIHQTLQKEHLLDRLLHVNYRLSKQSPSSNVDFEKIEIEDEIINSKLKQLLDDEILFEEVSQLINELKNFENTDEAKKYLKNLNK